MPIDPRSTRPCSANVLFGRLATISIALAFATLGLWADRSIAGDSSIILATTTSVRDSGLLDALLPEFSKQSGIEVQVIAVGSGAALRMGREGNADVLLTHAPDAEEKIMAEGVITRRTPFMENYFVIAGPAADPASIATATSALDAIHRIEGTRSRWVSRSDDSGTHQREQSLFAAAGLDPSSSWQGFERTGSGMGQSLQVAGELRAYILSDIGTFLAFQKRIDLVILSKPADDLRNVYSILQIDAARFKRPIASKAAQAFERFLVDAATQDRIAHFGVERYGRPLFTPLRPHAGAAIDAKD